VGASLLLLVVGVAVLLPGVTAAAPRLTSANPLVCQLQQGDAPTVYNVQVGYNAPAGSQPLNALTFGFVDPSIAFTAALSNGQPATPTGVGDAVIFYPFSLQSGLNAGVSLRTTDVLPANAGAQVYGSTDGFSSSNVYKCDMTLQAKPKEADLSVTKRLNSTSYEDSPLFNVLTGDDGYFWITVENKGPDDTTISITDLLPKGLEFTESSSLADQGCSGTTRVLTCGTPLAAGHIFRLIVGVTFTTATRGLPNENAVTVESTDGAVDPHPADNRAHWAYNVYPGLTSRIKAFDETKGFQPKPPEDLSGDAEERQPIGYRISSLKAPTANPALGKLAFVDIAVLSLRPTPGSPQTCRWLANSRAQFRSISASHGLCSKAIWLRATGTRQWKYTLTKSLPAGRYIAYSRAGDKAGAVQNVFSIKLKNRLDFTAR
jgi:uncharacterized repeat protein (TIGR01451 family)